MIFKNLKLGAKLMGGFALIAVIALVLGITGYYGTVKNGESIYEIGVVRLPSVQATFKIQAEILKILRYIRTLNIPNLPKEDYERQYAEIKEAQEAYTKAIAIYEPLPQTEEEAKEWESFKQALSEWTILNNKIIETHNELDQTDMSNQADAQKIAELQKRINEMVMAESRPIYNRAIQHLDNVIKINAEVAENEVEKGNIQAAFLQKTILIATLLGVILATVLGILLTISITRPILQQGC